MAMRHILGLAALMAGALCWGRGLLLPEPCHREDQPGCFTADSVSFVGPVEAEGPARRWRQWLDRQELVMVPQSAKKVVLELDSVPSTGRLKEAYSLRVTPDSIVASGRSPLALHRALETLMQLRQEKDGTEKFELPVTDISDGPAYEYRGVMLDVGRTYWPVEDLRRHIRLLSHFKINHLHLHLTDNEAWRLQSLHHPGLTSPASMQRQPGLYYTIDELRSLAQYAADHGMVLIPELDMPGHSAAFRRATGVAMDSPQGEEIVEDVLRELCEALPVEICPYIHLGTDETEYADPDFPLRMTSLLHSLGRKAVAWNPGYHFQDPSQVDLTMMWSYRGAPMPKGVPAVDERFHYLNHYDTFGDVVALWRSAVYPHRHQGDTIAGAQVAIWTDRYAHPSTLAAQNGLYPAAQALAERTWRGEGSEYFDSLGTRLSTDTLSEDFRAFADWERRLLAHKRLTLEPAGERVPYVRQSNVEWLLTEPFPNGGDLQKVFPPETEGPLKEYQFNGSAYGTTRARGAGLYLRHVWGTTVPGWVKDPQPNSTVYAFADVYSPVEQEAGALIEMHNASRSERDAAPPQGQWDWRGSRLWLNGQEIQSPVWTGARCEITHQTLLGNENLAARPPFRVRLCKGLNRVMLKLPVGEFTDPAHTRLVKWMFTFVLITPSGSEALPGIFYRAPIATR